MCSPARGKIGCFRGSENVELSEVNTTHNQIKEDFKERNMRIWCFIIVYRDTIEERESKTVALSSCCVRFIYVYVNGRDSLGSMFIYLIAAVTYFLSAYPSLATRQTHCT